MSKHTKNKVCFVTSELFPFAEGGIGKLITNLIQDSLNRGANVEFHILLPCWSEIGATDVGTYFSGFVQYHKAKSLDDQGGHANPSYRQFPPRWAFTDTVAHAESLELMLELVNLENSGTVFDFIEFPDHLGWSFCTLQEKKLGKWFQSTEVAVRLHTTAGIIHHFENGAVTAENTALHDLERKGLEDADSIIAHISEVADFNKTFYGFSENWRNAVKIEFPHVCENISHSEKFYLGRRDIVFLTKLQPFKKPDLFIKGASQFMINNPSIKGRAFLACRAVSDEYAKTIQNMVPLEIRERFIFIDDTIWREKLIPRAIVVIPSEYESLNLTAYECASKGAVLVLNSACVAFKNTSPFCDGKNCITFDGTVDDLEIAIKRAYALRTVPTVEWLADAPYYESVPTRRHLRVKNGRSETVSVVITNYNLGRYLPEALESIANSSYTNIEIVLVDDASTEDFDRELIGSINKKAVFPYTIKVICNVVNRGLSASRNIGIRASRGEYILPLDADDRINPHFLQDAVGALQRNNEFSVVVPTAGYFENDIDLENNIFVDYACFIGNTPTHGLMYNRFGCATSLIRKNVFECFEYDEKLDSYEDWSLYLQLALSGVRFIVTNTIQFYYRRRSNSMVKGVSYEKHQQLLSSIFSRLRYPLPQAIRMSALPVMLSGPRRPEHNPVEIAFSNENKKYSFVHNPLSEIMKVIWEKTHELSRELQKELARRFV